MRAMSAVHWLDMYIMVLDLDADTIYLSSLHTCEEGGREGERQF